MAALWLYQRHGVRDKGSERARLGPRGTTTAQVKKPLEIRLDQSELSQRYLKGRGIELTAARKVTLMQLHCQARSLNPVSQLMRQSSGNLSQQSQTLGALYRLLQARQPFGHVVYRGGEVANLIVTNRQRHRREIPGGD